MNDIKFELFDRQLRVLESDANEILYGGAAGGGKSHLIRSLSILYATSYKDLVIPVIRKELKDLIKSHIDTPGGYLEMLKPLIKSGYVKYDKKDFNLFFKTTGCKIQFYHAESPEYVKSHFQGSQFPVMFIDEASLIETESLKLLRSRVRLGRLKSLPNSPLRLPFIMYATNPMGKGKAYLKSNFAIHGADTVWQAPDEDGGMLREFIPSLLQDNKFMLENDPDYYKRLMGIGDPKLVNAMLNGDWGDEDEGVFSDILSKDNLIDSFNIPKGWIVDRGYDYGSASPSVCLYFAESNGEEFIDRDGNIKCYSRGSIIIIGEVYMADNEHKGLRLTPIEQARRIKEYESIQPWGGRVKAGCADNSIFNNEPGRASIYSDMQSIGILFKRGDKSPNSRIRGIGVMRSMISAGHKQPMTERGIFIFRDKCPNTYRTLMDLYPDSRNPEDVSANSEDHCWDVIRYKILDKYQQGMTIIGNL